MQNRARNSLGERELDIMQVLWQLETATVTEVQKALQVQHKSIAYTTVQTMLNRLETKKIVSRDTTGRIHRYRALLKQPNATANALQRLTERFFGGSAEAVVTRLVETDLTGEQLERIQSLIAAHQRKENAK